ncbi:MAG: NUDIX domain-containing protein [Microbacteriaceae bacterium]
MNETIYEIGPNPHIALVQNTTSDGKKYLWLEQQHGVPGVLAIATDGQRVLLQREYRRASGKFHLQFPRGYSDLPEDDRMARIMDAARELYEETGVVAEDAELLGYNYPDSGVLAARIAVVLTRVSTVALAEAEGRKPLIVRAPGAASTVTLLAGLPERPVPGEEPQGEDEGITGVIVLNRAELDELVFHGLIDDGITLSALALLNAHL